MTSFPDVGSKGTRLREAPDGRTIFIYRGPDDIGRLADAIAELAVAELFELNQSLVWLDGDQLIRVTKDVLRGVITANFVSVRLLDRGNGKWMREFHSLDIPERVLIEITAMLLGKVVKGPSTPKQLPESLLAAAQARRVSGEPCYLIARSFNVDLATIEALPRHKP